MAKELDPKKFQSFFEKVAETNVKAFEAQTRYFENLMKRNAALMSDLTASRINELKELAGTRDVSSAIKNSSAIQHDLQERMQQMYEENLAAWDELQTELKELYKLDNDLLNQMQASTKDWMVSTTEKVKSVVNRDNSGDKSAPKKPAAKKAASKIDDGK
ncbi:MAG: hypothetical protein CMK32_16650 [Porticoccaceae bacterium]|nr:hypothetical protein [Porticoccaceae bacterium]